MTPRGTSAAAAASPRSARGGGSAGGGLFTKDSTKEPQSSRASSAAAAPSSDTPRGLVAMESDEVPTGDFRLRSRSPTRAAASAHLAVQSYTTAPGGAGLSSVVATAEERLEAQLAGVKALLVDSVAAVQREHEGAVAHLRSDNRRLHAALAQARSKEAEYEEKLASAVGAMSGLAHWAQDFKAPKK